MKKKRVTIGGKIATGTSSVLAELKNKLDSKWKMYSTGDAMRNLAESHGQNIYDFVQNPPVGVDIDQIIDDMARAWLEKDYTILDSRCAHGYAPREKTLTILLDAPDEVRLERYFNREKNKKSELTKEAAHERMNMRDALDIPRFQKATNTDAHIYNPEHFDLILDSHQMSVDEIVNKILSSIEMD